MFMGPQRKWLNEMAAKGYRLVRAGKLEYEFEECEPGRYVYEIEYIGDKSFEHGKEYKEFLESFGYKVFYKNINLDYSVGKATINPFAEKGGRVMTNKTGYNKELLIIEKENDGRPFELHSTLADKIHYYQKLRNPWIIMTAVFMITGVLFLKMLLLIFGIICLVIAGRYEKAIVRCRNAALFTDAGGSIKEPLFMKIFIPVAVALTFVSFIIAFSGVLHSSTNYRSGTFIGYIENHYKGVLSVSYGKASGKLVRTLSPKNDAKEITADITTDSGTVKISVKSTDGDILWECPEGSVNEEITIPTSGEKVTISFDFEKCGGSADFEYK